ncbi:MAG: hypothetical protein QF473_21060 [Planctomycetota bacterium]|nr:hypothetical protein [Planctomycetota bacterium]
MTVGNMAAFALSSSVILMVSPAPSLGQDFQKGDRVRIQFGGKTHTTKVEDVLPNGWIRVKIRMNGVVMTPTLPPAQAKRLAGQRPRSTSSKTEKPTGGSGMRSWKDSDGKLITVGKMLKLEKGEVHVRSASGITMMIPLDKLSDSDKKLASGSGTAGVREWKGADGALLAEGTLLKVENGQAHIQGANGITMMIPLEKLSAEAQRLAHAGPGTSSGTAVSGHADSPFGEVDWSEVPEITLPTDAGGEIQPDAATAAKVSTRPIAFKSSRSILERPVSLLFNTSRNIAYCNLKEAKAGGRSRLERFSLTRGVSLGSLSLPIAGDVQDVSPSGSLLLWRSDKFRGGTKNKLMVLKVAGTSTRQVLAYEPYPSDNWAQRDVSFTAFLDEDHVLAAGARGRLSVWNIKTHEVVYQIPEGARGRPALSPGRKQLAMISDRGIAVLNALTGNPLGLLPGDTRTHFEVAFRPDGKSVASLTGQKLMVWDLQSAKLLYEIPLNLRLSNYSMDWVADNHILIGDQHLLDLERRVVLWQYSFEAGTGTAKGSFAGRYWYTVGGVRQSRKLVSVELPHPKVVQTAQKIADEIMVLAPGKTVSLVTKISGTPQQQKWATDWLRYNLKRNELKVTPGQNLTVEATTADGETKERKYKSFGRAGNENHKVTQKISKVEVKEKGRKVWETKHVNNGPIFLNMKKGESIADALRRHMVFNLQFFKDVQIPRLLARPGEGGSYGSSKLTAAGVVEIP